MSQNTMRGLQQKIILTESTRVLPMQGMPLPATITLTSSDAGRKIEVSTNDQTKYFQPAYDYSDATTLVVALVSGVTHVKLTGAAGDQVVVA